MSILGSSPHSFWEIRCYLCWLKFELACSAEHCILWRTGHCVTIGGLGKENNPFGYWHTNVREFAMPFTFRLGKIQKNYIIFHISYGVCLRQDLHPPGRKYFRVLQNVPSLWWTTWSSLSNRLNAPFSFLQVFFLIVGVVCPLSQKRTPFAAHSLGEKRALGNSLSFAIWNVMLIPNYLKSNHKVWWKKKKSSEKNT